MAKRVCVAILGLRNTDYDDIVKQAGVFLEKFYQEIVLYPNPLIPEIEFREQYEKARKASTAAVKGSSSDKATHKQECAILYKWMQDKLIEYINSLYAGNRPLLERSGAKIKSDPTPVPPPDQPIIKRIERGPEPNSVKIFLVRGINSKQKRRSRLCYFILMYKDMEVRTGIEVGSSWSSINLIGYDVPDNEYLYFAVRASNSSGSSLPSSRVKYFLSYY
jgi:hypothetical protein